MANSPLDALNRYRVGGAVRDRLLGYPSDETDWVVVGATPEQLVAAGLTPVGRDFPVFIDPASGDEYALARTERKNGHGYHGFNFYAAADVTLEQDLQRRDLTVNAIAEDANGELTDPCGGVSDLQHRLLRHISPAFCEDPLRVLRVARFAARYHHLGFTVAPQTLALMQQISASGELQYLSAERVWRETDRALGERDGAIYVQTLVQCGAFEKLFAELAGSPVKQEQLCETLAAADRAGHNSAEKFALLCARASDAGCTPRSDNHSIEQLCKRLRTPTKTRQLTLQLCRFGPALRTPRSLSAEQLLAALQGSGGLKSADKLAQLLHCAARLPQPPLAADSEQLLALQRSLAQISIADIVAAGASGQEIGEALYQRQLQSVQALLGSH